MQKLSINNFFGDIVKAEWVLSIELTPTSQAKIQSSFSCDVELHYPRTLERFDDLIEDFQLKTIEDTDSINETEYGEDKNNQRSYCYGQHLWFSRPIKYIHQFFDSD